MPSLLIKDFPPELHRKLKDEAARHHRSMTRQALALLEQALSEPARNRRPAAKAAQTGKTGSVWRCCLRHPQKP